MPRMLHTDRRHKTIYLSVYLLEEIWIPYNLNMFAALSKSDETDEDDQEIDSSIGES